MGIVENFAKALLESLPSKTHMILPLMTHLTSATSFENKVDLAAQGKLIGLIPAAGVGSRMQSSLPKQFLTLGDQTLLALSVGALLRHPRIDQVIVVVSPEDTSSKALLGRDYPEHIDQQLMVIACGGATRAESVANGLHFVRDVLKHCASQDWVLVHDAARPGLSQAALDRLINQVLLTGQGGLLALPIVDTVKLKRDEGAIQTVPREGLWAAQTPQMFRINELNQALALGFKSMAVMTDEAQAIESLGLPVQLILGERVNTKVTVPEDLVLVGSLLKIAKQKDLP